MAFMAKDGGMVWNGNNVKQAYSSEVREINIENWEKCFIEHGSKVVIVRQKSA